MGARRQNRGISAGGFMRRVRNRSARAPGDRQAAPSEPDDRLDWSHLLDRLSVVRHRWDLAILTNLGAEQGTRSAELLASVNSQADGRQLSPQVLSVRLRALERDGYVRHTDLTRIPLVRVYFLLPQGRAMLRTLRGLAPWNEQMPDRRSGAVAGRQ